MIVICDLDGTLADNRHRKNMPRSKHGKEMLKDSVNTNLLDVLDALNCDGRGLVIFTARSERYRKATAKWLRRQGVDYESLVMRAIGDIRKDAEVKQDMLDQLSETVLCAFDDKKSCIKMYRHNGICTFGVKLPGV